MVPPPPPPPTHVYKGVVTLYFCHLFPLENADFFFLLYFFFYFLGGGHVSSKCWCPLGKSKAPSATLLKKS